MATCLRCTHETSHQVLPWIIQFRFWQFLSCFVQIDEASISLEQDVHHFDQLASDMTDDFAFPFPFLRTRIIGAKDLLHACQS
jgi:hypothetical protein